MGVWIEITKMVKRENHHSSLPAWECGLKFGIWFSNTDSSTVTPCVGVWIEIVTIKIDGDASGLSLPAWECGLKYFCLNQGHHKQLSLPAWECGLKVGIGSEAYTAVSHSLRGSVDWNFPATVISFLPYLSLPAWECGLKYDLGNWESTESKGHSLRGSVDWNFYYFR